MLYLSFPFWSLGVESFLYFCAPQLSTLYSYVHSKLSLLYFILFRITLFHYFIYFSLPSHFSLYSCIPICTYSPYLICSETHMKPHQIWSVIECLRFNLQIWYLCINHIISLLFHSKHNVLRYIHTSLYVSKLLLLTAQKYFTHHTYAFSM